MDQETAVVESELSQSAESDLKPCSDPGSSFSLTRVSFKNWMQTLGLGLQNHAFSPFCLPPLLPFCACVALGVKDI